jgi:hypothetical protein
MHISSHEIVHSFLYDENPQRRYVAVRLRNEERPSVFLGTLPVFQTSRSPSFPTLLTIVNFHIFKATYPFCSSTYFSHDDDD